MFINLLFIVYIFIASISSEQLQAPIIRSVSKDKSVSPGSPEVFTCSANGNPPPTYIWLRDWENLTTSYSSLGHYKIISVQKQDQGSYRCLAKNDLGVFASKAIRLTVWHFDSSANEQQDRYINGYESDAVILIPPVVNSSPTPTVKWFMKTSSFSQDTKRIIANEKYFITPTDHLVILNADFHDEKIYYAVIENIYTGASKQSPNYILRINRRKSQHEAVKPEIVVKPADQIATLGDATKPFACVANAGSHHQVEIIWRKNSVLIDGTDSRFVTDSLNRTLEIHGITLDDQGIYSCHVRIRNMDTYINASAKLTVQGVPTITTNFPSIQNVDLQDQVIFNCNEAQTSISANVTWYKNAVRLTNQSSKIQLIENQLILNDIEWEDQGIYQCFLTNDVGEDTRSTWLKIKSEKPTISISKNLIVYNGADIQLTCNANGSPRPNITWFKLNDDERTLLNNTHDRIHVDHRTGVLSISNTQRTDSGLYECSAQNILGSVSGRTTLLVRRRTKILSFPQTMKIIKAQSLVLVCPVFSEVDVSTNIQWYFNHNQIISPMKLFNESTVSIDAPQNHDTGNYTCMVESEAGNDSRTVEVTVLELPWPPTFVGASLVNDSISRSVAVNLTWIPNFDGNMPIERYTVQMKDCSSLSDNNEYSRGNDEAGWENKEYIMVQRNMMKTWTLLRGLRPFATYQFRLSAWNQLGEGQVSTPSNNLTLPEEIPSGTVRSLKVIARDSISIYIDYMKPIESTINGRLIGYNINYALNYPNLHWKSVRVNSSTLSYYLEGLMTWESYSISVSVVNNVGVGPPSEIVKVRTLEGRPTRGPTITHCEPVNATAIMIKWQGPPSSYINGILSSFKIELTDLNRNTTLYQEQQAKPIELYQLVISNLKKFTNYSIRISCATKIGNGPWSSLAHIQTLEDVPDQVENLTFSNVYDTSLDITWQKPSEVNGQLLGYELEWHHQTNGTQSDQVGQSTVEVGPHLTTYTINNLLATTWYVISVRARTRKGFGLKRSASIESGYPPEMPSAPTHLEVISVEQRSAIIKFSPGYTGKTNILRYIVQSQMRSNNSQWETIQSFHVEQSKLILRDLYPNRLYRIRMSAVNIKGISNTSIPTEFFRTKPDVPSSVPQVLLARAINSSSIRVRWIPIATNEWNSVSSTGKDIGYLVSINDSLTRPVRIEDPQKTEHIFNDLSPANTLFLIQLHTYNSIGLSKTTIETMEKTFESAPLRPPSNIRVDYKNGTSARIQWSPLSPLDQGGLIKSYKISYYSLSSLHMIHTIDYSDNRSSNSYLLHNLDGYTNYSFSISACTSTGCSEYSQPQSFTTEESVPSKPTEVLFRTVNYQSAEMSWQPPAKLNGILLGYRLVYWHSNDEQTRIEIDNLTSSDHRYAAGNLTKTTRYTFILCAKTRVGCGEPSINRLLTIKERSRPAAPRSPTVNESSINATSLVLKWTKNSEFNYAPIRYVLIEYQEESTDIWKSYDQINEPDEEPFEILIENLKPNTRYRFRLASQNDIGISDYSLPTSFYRTKETAPSIQPEIDRISAVKPCQIDVYLKPNDQIMTFRENTRFKVLIRSQSNEQILEKSYHSINESHSIHLDNLCKESYMNDTHVLYVALSNAIGDGPLSYANYFHIQSPAPNHVVINTMNISVLSSTEISIQWNVNQILPSMNYRIRWIEVNQTDKEQSLIASYNESNMVIDSLVPFTFYKVMINIFNVHGDGPVRESDLVQTNEDVPGPVDQLVFSYVTFTSLKINWQPPKSINGILRSYELTYDNRLSFSTLTNTSSTRVKTIKQSLSPNITSLRIDDLDPYQYYEFTLCACTIRCGSCIHKTIQASPQKNSPSAPFNLSINKHNLLKWKTTPTSEYYLIEISVDSGHTWEFLAQTSESSYALNTNRHLLSNHSIEHYFRIYSVNHIGISNSSDIYRHNFTTLSSLSFTSMLSLFRNAYKFIRENPLSFIFIMCLLTLLVIMFICIIITWCCCRMKLNKTKLLQSNNTLSSNLNIAESKQSLYTTSTLLTPIKRELTMQRNRDSLALSDLLYNNMSTRSPPRPIPTPIVYDDLTSTKSLLNNTGTNHVPEENQPTADYSWYHALPQQLYTYMTNNHLTNRITEENEHDENDLTVAFNGAILMNNVPRSRAAVNGCSSFAL